MEITQTMRDEARDFPTSNTSNLLFSNLVQCLEMLTPNLQTSTKKSRKKTKVQTLLSKELLNQVDGHSLFPLIRLVVPFIDHERPNYNLKEKALGKLFCEAAGCTLKSDTGKALIHFNNPKYVGSDIPAGDFPTVLEGVLARRCFAGGTLTIGDVNELLDELAHATNKKQKTKVLEKLYTKMDSTELKWICRIVLQDLKIGLKHEKILAYIHPDAVDMFSKCSDVRLVLATLNNPDKRRPTALSLMSPFETMQGTTAHGYDCTTDRMVDGFLVEWKCKYIPVKTSIFNFIQYHHHWIKLCC